VENRINWIQSVFKNIRSFTDPYAEEVSQGVEESQWLELCAEFLPRDLQVVSTNPAPPLEPLLREIAGYLEAYSDHPFLQQQAILPAILTVAPTSATVVRRSTMPSWMLSWKLWVHIESAIHTTHFLQDFVFILLPT
jgi:hypothetical protein